MLYSVVVAQPAAVMGGPLSKGHCSLLYIRVDPRKHFNANKFLKTGYRDMLLLLTAIIWRPIDARCIAGWNEDRLEHMCRYCHPFIQSLEVISQKRGTGDDEHFAFRQYEISDSGFDSLPHHLVVAGMLGDHV